MSTFTATMFDSIKQALNKQTKSGGIGDIMRCQAGNTYEIRLLPCVKNPDKTFFSLLFSWMDQFCHRSIC